MVRAMLQAGAVNTSTSSIQYRTQPQARLSLKAALFVCASAIAAAVAMIAFTR